MTTLIIGGGLSGLALADALEAQGKSYILLEARARFGGRIKTERHEDGYFDMGPAWFWPGQPRIAALLAKLNLEKFDQFATGDLAYEDERGQVQRGRGFSSMEGSWRLKGGLGAMIQALADRLPADRKRLNAAVTDLTRTDHGVIATLSTGDTVEAEQAVLCMPPRVAANIAFDPPLPQTALTTMQNVPTWMAGQAKAVAVYDTPFWREDGLSGDAQSRFGPMVEIHDASPADGGPYALFGFIGVPPKARADEPTLRRHLTDQLTRLFGAKAGAPTQLYIKDWAFDPYTSTDADQAPLYAHPTYGMPPSLMHVWGPHLHFSGTEVAPQFGGYLEGALEAAENILDTLITLE
ncbi:NAD(P)/FAD-dependent oxidoreductase [Roseobacter sp.]|uniref:flavin monoamine oxidase family protein n=1 Tax=Roseobacter sp. TaxID=1907202 RepID=UPI00329A422C